VIPGVDELALFIAAGVLLNLTPGPDVLFIVAQGLRHGARTGIVAALGISAGCLVHVVAAAVGVGALIAASTTAFSLLKWLGAAYLVFIGLRMLIRRGGSVGVAAPAAGPMATTPRVSLRAVWVQAFWTNALNPKVALFFLAFLPQFIAPGTAQAFWSFLALGLVFTFNSSWINIGYGVLAAWAASRLALVQRGLAGLDRIAGALFVGFGARLALTEP
jgi:threonine/homoserine/homoserine lactone efflux protein